MFTLTTFVYFWVDTFATLLVLRFIHGISFAVLTTTTGAIAADIVPNARRGAGLGYFAMAMNLAVVAGPFIGLTLVQSISFNLFFLILSILMVISVIFSFMVHVEELKTRSSEATTFKVKDMLEPNALPIAVFTGIVGIAYTSVLSFVPVFAEENGLQSTANYFFLIFAVMMIASRPTLGRIFDEKGAKVVLVPSLVVFSFGLIVLSLTNGSLLLLIAAAVIGLGYGSLLPGFQALAVQSATSDRSGHAISTFFMLFDIGISTGAFIWGFVIAGAGFTSMYLSGAILMFVTSVALYHYLTRQNKLRESKSSII